jgi:hypothetical protein
MAEKLQRCRINMMKGEKCEYEGTGSDHFLILKVDQAGRVAFILSYSQWVYWGDPDNAK